MSSGVREPSAWRSRAATAAACGAAAEVPKKFGKPSASKSEPKKVVLPPSAATISGLLRISGFAKRVPCVSKKTCVEPAAENEFNSGGSTPNSGVLKYADAPTASAPAALACP